MADNRHEGAGGNVTKEASDIAAGDGHKEPPAQSIIEKADLDANVGNTRPPVMNGETPNRAQNLRHEPPADALLRKDFFDRLQEDKYTNGEPLYQHLAALAKRLHITSSVRFETARRHKKKNRMSTISIIILSFYAILFSMISTFGNLTDKYSKEILAMLSIFMASFIVALTIYETSKRYDARSESFMRFAISAQKLRDRAVRAIFSKMDVNWKSVAEIEDAFHQLSTEYTDNHSHIDYDEHRIRVGKIRGARKYRKKVFLIWNIWNLAIFSLLSPIIIYEIFVFVLWLYKIPNLQ